MMMMMSFWPGKTSSGQKSRYGRKFSQQKLYTVEVGDHSHLNRRYQDLSHQYVRLAERLRAAAVPVVAAVFKNAELGAESGVLG